MFDQRHGNALFAFMFASIAICEGLLPRQSQPSHVVLSTGESQ
jgi:predicted amidohydrolase